MMGCVVLQSNDKPPFVPLTDSRNKAEVTVQREEQKCQAATTFAKEYIHMSNKLFWYANGCEST